MLRARSTYLFNQLIKSECKSQLEKEHQLIVIFKDLYVLLSVSTTPQQPSNKVLLLRTQLVLKNLVVFTPSRLKLFMKRLPWDRRTPLPLSDSRFLDEGLVPPLRLY